MNKDQILALSSKHKIDVSPCAAILEKASRSAYPLLDTKSDVEECQNHLDSDFMKFLASGGHLDVNILPVAV